MYIYNNNRKNRDRYVLYTTWTDSLKYKINFIQETEIIYKELVALRFQKTIQMNAAFGLGCILHDC